jgi:hypothetical protein
MDTTELYSLHRDQQLGRSHISGHLSTENLYDGPIQRCITGETDLMETMLCFVATYGGHSYCAGS